MARHRHPEDRTNPQRTKSQLKTGYADRRFVGLASKTYGSLFCAGLRVRPWLPAKVRDRNKMLIVTAILHTFHWFLPLIGHN
jgi:hypothetical protein